MPTIRKANAYSKRKVTPYTRKSKRKNRAYIKVIPPSCIIKYEMGNIIGFAEGKFPYHLKLVANQNIQIRDGAIEACRQYVNRILEKSLAKQYFYRIAIHPHHIERENKMLTGAGSDRMQTGMQLSFGKCMDRAAIVKKGSTIFLVALADKKGELFARALLKKIESKLPCTTRFVSEVVK